MNPLFKKIRKLSQTLPKFFSPKTELEKEGKKEILAKPREREDWSGRISCGKQAKSWKKIWIPIFGQGPVVGGKEKGRRKVGKKCVRQGSRGRIWCEAKLRAEKLWNPTILVVAGCWRRQEKGGKTLGGAR